MTTLEKTPKFNKASLDKSNRRLTLVEFCVERDERKHIAEVSEAPSNGVASKQDSLKVYTSLIDHPPHNLLQLITRRVPRRLRAKQRSIPARTFDPSRVEERPPSISSRRLGRGIVRRGR